MTELKNDLLLRAAAGEVTERPPVWLMRQAGRILPEYRAVRASVSGFVELVKTPELACEVTLQPVDILGVDAAIIFSDILVIPEAMGLPYEMHEGKGPRFPQTVGAAADLKQLRVATEEHFQYVTEAIALTRRALAGRVPLIGFAGAPWTIFCYMVEGQGSKTFSKARAMLVKEPVLAHHLLELITASTIGYLRAQAAAGAQLLQLFDSWAGILSPELYRAFALPYLAKICAAVQEVPLTVFGKGAWFALEDFAKLDCQVVGLDWHTPVAYARQQLPGKTLQGNLDPAVLYGSPAEIKKKTQAMVAEFKGQPHIANLGHGVYPDISADHAKAFVDAVKASA